MLKAICSKIAADEFRHYKLFYSHLKRYLKREEIGPLKRSLVALGRIRESEDDELAYAYYAANGADQPYDRKRWAKAYMNRAYGYYRPHHVERVVAMTFKAAGLKPQGRLAKVVVKGAYLLVKWRGRQPANDDRLAAA